MRYTWGTDMTLSMKAWAFGIGLIGVATGLLVWHLYQDHVAVHSIADFLNSQIAASQKAK